MCPTTVSPQSWTLQSLKNLYPSLITLHRVIKEGYPFHTHIEGMIFNCAEYKNLKSFMRFEVFS